MPLEFGQRQPPEKLGKRRPPPNYSSRRVQWKVFMYVAMIMLVVILMQEAKKAERWEWMWQLQKEGGISTARDKEGDVDTRLREPDKPHIGTDADLIMIGVDPEQPAVASTGEEESGKAADRDPAERSRHDAWSRMLESLSSDDRPRFLKGLKAARDKILLPEDDREAWAGIVVLLDQGWQHYLNDAFLAIGQDDGRLNDEEKKVWLDVVEDLRIDWNDRVRPSLDAMGGGEVLTDEQRQAFSDVQHTLDRVFLDAVRDNTVFRTEEQDAWFRLLEELERRDAEELQQSSIGHVGFLQLYRQPKEYRGQLVTVQGQLRLGYHRQPARNIYGITDYYYFWLKPIGATSPIVVYCLDVPDGFPDVKAIEAAGEKPTLSEDVEFTGYFFKRWAYRAGDGTRLAPVLLAKTPRWERRIESAGLPTDLPGPKLWIVIVGGSCLLGIGIATTIFWLSKRSMPRRDHPESVRIPKHIGTNK
ncbi:MAG: hypothetical protein H8E44_36655 [Planctomycetes bacterium]|nr:hypothetical protein [Planctomycetota bacterium]